GAWGSCASAIVLCLDVGITMSSSAPGEESSLEQAKKVITKFLQRQVFAESKDEVALVLFGTDGTKNDLASRDQYQNITVHRSLMLPDFDLLGDIQNMIQLGSQQADCILLEKSGSQRCEVGSGLLLKQLSCLSSFKKSAVQIHFRRILCFPCIVCNILLQFTKEFITVFLIPLFRESLERLAMFKKIERRPVPWQCLLTIGSNLSIRIVAYKAVKEKVKKIWTVVDAKTLRKEDVQRETVYCLNDDDETEIQKDDTIQGMTSLCASWRQTRDNGCLTSDSKDDENAAVAFSALVQALDELNVVAIVRYAYDRRCNPQIGVAFPCIKDTYECLFYVQLPYMEDVRQYMFSSLKNNKKCTPTGKRILSWGFVDSLSKLFLSLNCFLQCLQHKAFHPNEPLPPIEQHLLEMLEMPRVVKERCKAPLEKVKALFRLKDAGKKKEEKTAQDIFKDDEDGLNAKRRKIEDEEDSFSIMKLAEGNVTSVSKVLKPFLSKGNINFSKLSQQLINRIDQFLENRSSQYYMKGIDCIRVFRGEAVKLSKVQCFNDFLQALKSKVEDKALADFWEIVVQDRISLITKDEAEGSSVTSEEAEKVS
uniref:X-ray repair cross complementing 5 n=1 Tax=Pavo cristatus TaxID=9049 RepID=A0A8C9ELL3_PAVCR